MNLWQAVQLFINDRKLRDCNAGTLQTYASQLRLFVDWLESVGVVDTSALTSDCITRYLDSLREREQLRRDGKLSPVTIHKRAKHIRTFLLWLVRRGSLSPDVLDFPVPKIRRRLPKSLKPDEIDLLLSASLSTRDRAIILLMLDTGLRLSEVAALVLDDLDFRRGMIHVRHGKGDKERYVLFGAVCAEHLQAWLAERRTEHQALFVDKWGKPLTAGGVYKIVRRAARSVGLKIHPHQLRHTFATEFLDAGGQVTDLQKLLGHSDINTTMIYSNVSLGAIRQRFGSLSLVNRLAADGRARGFSSEKQG